MRLGVVEHELTENTGIEFERNEHQGADIFPCEHLRIFSKTFIAKYVRDSYRLHIACPARPRRMSGYGLPVLRRQIAPSFEADDPIVVESQDRRAIGVGCG